VALACCLRIWFSFPVAHRRPRWPGLANLWGLLRSSLWTSMSQLAQLMVFGTDLIGLNWLLGPQVVVLYACTGKLVNVLQNYPNMLIASATPALSELRAGEDRERFRRAFRALSQTVVAASGALVLAIVSVNAAFVSRWVGPDRFGGPWLTLALVAGMFGRHVVFTWSNTAFILGHEGRLAIAAILDGAVTISASVVWTWLVGPVGPVLGSLTALALVTAPVGLTSVAASSGVSILGLVWWILHLVLRLAAVFVPLAVSLFFLDIQSPWVAGGLLITSALGYILALLPLRREDPFRIYWARLRGLFGSSFARVPSSPAA
jgi:O-antigen/teichoic acid export membrane protein